MTAIPTHEAGFRVAPDHPSLEGHFPGNPLLPGVVVLDEVISAVEDWLGPDWRARGLPQVKFVSPLRPGDEAVIRLERREHRVLFVVHCGEAIVAQGVLSGAGAGSPR